MPSRIVSQSSEPDAAASGKSAAVDERAMKRVAALFAAGVTVVTTRRAEGLHGLTLSAYLTVSWGPPFVLISVERLSQSRDFIIDSGVFAVNFLTDLQEFVAERFAGRAPLVNARFDGVPHHFEATGAPILDGALGWLDCRVEQVIEAGDHTLILGRVVALGEDAPGNALAHFARQYRSIEP
jgi:flavin reductase (DIM6/NTAB) family NADH-FMN oxidoreductase RutF